jgi:gliding motility-associated-like protein
MRYPILCLILLMVVNTAMGQGEDKIWTFGHHNGLNFNNNPPTFFQSSNTSIEGCASICDAAGNLLFYSNGNDVWTATGVVMPNGTGILGNGSAGFAPCSSAQGAAIVRSLSNPNQYYLFTLDASEQMNPPNYPGYLRYSVIDMTLNGGAGDVVAGQKNIMLDTGMCEQMVITKGAGCYYWLLAHRNDSNLYRAFKIDAAGIHPGISSPGIGMGGLGAGQLKVSPDGTKIANANSFMSTAIELGNFNNATGVVSGVFLIDPVINSVRLGCCFSPDNSKLYITNMTPTSDVVQYDLAAFPNAAAITASKTIIQNNYQFSYLRNGPDGKIYVAIYQNHPFLSVINNPNNAGATCNFVLNGLAQPAWAAFAVAGGPYGHGLGSDVVAGLNTDTTVNNTLDTVLCFEETLQVTAPSGYADYLWNDGVSGPSRPITADGTYWVYSYESCAIMVDSFKVKFINLDADLGPDTAICNNSTLLLDATSPGAGYLWQDGSTNPTFTVTQAGSYNVRLTKDNCITADTIIISMFEPYLDILENDTTICNDEQLTLHATAAPISNYLWNNGSTAPELAVNQAGSYWVTATNACGTFTDSITIETENCDCRSFIPNAFSPNGDEINDVFSIRTNCQATNFTMSIYNRYGQRVFITKSPDGKWDGTFNGEKMDVGTYFYYVKFKGPRGDDFERKGDLVLLR